MIRHRRAPAAPRACVARARGGVCPPWHNRAGARPPAPPAFRPLLLPGMNTRPPPPHHSVSMYEYIQCCTVSRVRRLSPPHVPPSRVQAGALRSWLRLPRLAPRRRRARPIPRLATPTLPGARPLRLWPTRRRTRQRPMARRLGPQALRDGGEPRARLVGEPKQIHARMRPHAPACARTRPHARTPLRSHAPTPPRPHAQRLRGRGGSHRPASPRTGERARTSPAGLGKNSARSMPRCTRLCPGHTGTTTPARPAPFARMALARVVPPKAATKLQVGHPCTHATDCT